MKKFLIAFVSFLPSLVEAQREEVRHLKTDLLVVGGGVGGTAAAIQCSRMGVKTILTEETSMLGGMLTAAGVSCTDGNDQFPSGIWEEFRQLLYKHYGRKPLNSGWVSNTCFEPHVGDSIFKAMAADEKNLRVYFGYRFLSVIKKQNTVTGAWFFDDRSKSKIRIDAVVVTDATELGDVLAAARAEYDLGMDDPAISGETEAKEENAIIQDLTWAAILKDYGAGADKTIPRPTNYDSTRYFCSTSDAPCHGKPYQYDVKKVLNYGKLPHGKYMLNWPPHGNDFYLNVVEMKPADRDQHYELARQQTLGFIYFLQTQLGMKNIGLADDELNNGMALIPYNREGRRVKGVVRFTVNHIKNPYAFTLYRTGIAVGDYPVDHHHAQYPGAVPEIEFPKIPAYNIPMGALIPEKVDGLIVCEKGISVTNIVNGTTRLQPVVMLTGQAAGALAAKSILLKKKPRHVPVRDVQTELLKATCYLMPFSDVKRDDPAWEAIQKVGLTGVLKGAGAAEGWANKMYFYPDSLVMGQELRNGLFQLTRRSDGWPPPGNEQKISMVYSKLKGQQKYWWTKEFFTIPTIDVLKDHWLKWGLTNFDPERFITRRELAVMLDKCLLLFGSKNLLMDINGKMRFQYSEF